MVTTCSKKIRTLTESELVFLNQEKSDSSHLWEPHDYPESAPFKALQYGKSLLIQTLRRNPDGTTRDHLNRFPKTLELLSSIANASLDRLGRTFWHRLQPNERIDTHKDAIRYHTNTTRYQIYLTVPQTATIVLDERLWNLSDYPEESLSNSIIKFQQENYHFYFNGSNEPIEFLVFDFVND